MLIDSGPLYAAFDRHDARHAEAYEFFRQATGVYQSTWPVVTEVSYPIEASPHGPPQFS